MVRFKHPRFMLFLVVFILSSALGLAHYPPQTALMAGFDLGVVAFIATSVPLFLREGYTPIGSSGDDGGRILLPLTAGVVFGAVMLSIGWMISGREQLTAVDFLWVAWSLMLAWIFINILYAFHYAHIFFGADPTKPVGGLDFPGGQVPDFADLCYFSFVVGMTCQVSDVVVTGRGMRRVVLFHGLLAFFFNLGVVALTINVLSGVL